MLGWARKFSLFHYPYVTACCGMEYMSTACAHFDIDRFGAGWTRFSPRQSDLLLVVGTITQKLAPVLKTVYDQMTEPKWVIAFGACAVSGGIYDNYAVVQGIDQIIPVDILYSRLPAAAGDGPRRASQTPGQNPESRAGLAMEEKEILDDLVARFPTDVLETSAAFGDATIVVRRDALGEIVTLSASRPTNSPCSSI